MYNIESSDFIYYIILVIVRCPTNSSTKLTTFHFYVLKAMGLQYI